MNRTWKDRTAYILVLILALLTSACSWNGRKDADKLHDNYTCPMHPDIVRDAPGSCPICGMDLVKVRAAESSAASPASGKRSSTDSLNMLLKRPDEYVVSSIETVKPQEGEHYEDQMFSGVVTYNTTKLRMVAARVAGRIEKLYVKYNYQRVEKGQELMEIYSPDLLAAQRELLFLRGGSDQELLQRAKQKLLLLGATEQQVAGIVRTGMVKERFPVYSPHPGYVVEMGAAGAVSRTGQGTAVTASVSPPTGDAMSGMGGANSAASVVSLSEATSLPFSVVEGQYLSQGQPLFQIVDDSSLWAEFYVRPELVQSLKKGMKLKVFAEGQQLKADALIDVVLPYFKDRTQFSLIRATISNKGGKWKVGQLLSIKVKGKLQEGNWLPQTALLSLGRHYVVFLKRDGAFVPQAVSVSGRSGELFNVGKSVPPDAEVADNAWFLVDSESFVRFQAQAK